MPFEPAHGIVLLERTPTRIGPPSPSAPSAAASGSSAALPLSPLHVPELGFGLIVMKAEEHARERERESWVSG